MTLEWIDPPMNHADHAEQIAEELSRHPLEWARIARNISDGESDKWIRAFYLSSIELRHVRVDRRWWAVVPELRRYDLYARAPEENR